MTVYEREELRREAQQRVDLDMVKVDEWEPEPRRLNRPWSLEEYRSRIDSRMWDIRESRKRKRAEDRRIANYREKRAESDRDATLNRLANFWRRSTGPAKRRDEAELLRVLAGGQSPDVAEVLQAIAKRIDPWKEAP